jgi:hypothetical protein
MVLFNYDAAKAMVANFPSQVLGLTVGLVMLPGWATFSVLAFVFAVIAPSQKPYRPLPPPPPIPR